MIKRIIFIFLILLFSFSSAYAFGPISTSGDEDFDCSGYDICQNFEGSGYDNGEQVGVDWNETDGSTPIDPDYTPAITGSQSLLLADTGTDSVIEAVFSDHGDETVTSVYFEFKYTTDPSGADGKFIEIQDDGTTALLIYLDGDGANDGKLKAYCGGTNTIGGTTIAMDTKYSVWVEWQSETGVGGDGHTYVYLTTTIGTKPAGKEIEVTDCTNDYPGINGVLWTARNGSVRIMDRTLIKNGVIGNVQ